MDTAFTAAFLTEPEKLVRWWGDTVGDHLPNLYCHHCTIEHDPDGVEPPEHTLGEQVRLKVVGFAENSRAQAVLIEGVHSENEHPHVTVAVGNDVPPSDSKKALRGTKIHPVDGPVLTAVVGFSTGTQPHFSRDGFELTATRQLDGDESGELHVFDFDGTLFRSPGPPDDFDKHESAWWVFPDSLSEPHVPGKPDLSWYFPNRVETARQSVRNTDVMSVLITGRSANNRGLEFRIRDLLRQQELHFDHFLLSNMQRTEHFKRRAVQFLLHKHGLDKVRVWENNHLNLYQIKQAAETIGAEFQGNLVEDTRLD